MRGSGATPQSCSLRRAPRAQMNQGPAGVIPPCTSVCLGNAPNREAMAAGGMWLTDPWTGGHRALGRRFPPILLQPVEGTVSCRGKKGPQSSASSFCGGWCGRGRTWMPSSCGRTSCASGPRPLRISTPHNRARCSHMQVGMTLGHVLFHTSRMPSWLRPEN